MKSRVSGIVISYMRSTGLKLQRFGDAFGVVHGTVINWRDGRTEPTTDLLLQFKDLPDWRGEFSRDCLHVRHPDKF